MQVLLCLALLWSSPIQEIVDSPYVNLLEPDIPKYSRDELRALRSELEKQRDRQIGSCDKEAERLRGELDAARKKLKDLNESSSRDTNLMAENRSGIHSTIGAAEHLLLKSHKECRPGVSTTFETKLNKVQLAENWPKRRDKIQRLIEEGRARDRRYGDIEDIGYRKFFDRQEDDIPVGEQAVRQMKADGFLPEELPDADVQAYVRRLALKIASNSDLKVPLHVAVVNSEQINSVALPGGFLFISSGLIAAAQTESELAGVLSNEIARIAARHGTRASKRSWVSTAVVQAANIATGFLTGGIGSRGALFGISYGFQGLDQLAHHALAGKKEKYQTEANQLGTQYAWKAGFDPKGFIAFLDSTAQKEPAITGSFFREHSNLDQRLLDFFAEIQFLPAQPNAIVDTAEFQRMKERIPAGINSVSPN